MPLYGALMSQQLGLEDEISFEMVEQLILGFAGASPASPGEGSTDNIGLEAEEGLLDFADDFFTLCGNLDGDSSLSLEQMVRSTDSCAK